MMTVKNKMRIFVVLLCICCLGIGLLLGTVLVNANDTAEAETIPPMLAPQLRYQPNPLFVPTMITTKEEITEEPPVIVEEVVEETSEIPKEYNLNDVEQEVFDACTENDLDPIKTIAICRLETGNFKSNAFLHGNNYCGICKGGKPVYYNSREDGLNAMIKTMTKYKDQSVDEMASRYCPPNYEEWARLVKQIMSEYEQEKHVKYTALSVVGTFIIDDKVALRIIRGEQNKEDSTILDTILNNEINSKVKQFKLPYDNFFCFNYNFNEDGDSTCIITFQSVQVDAPSEDIAKRKIAEQCRGLEVKDVEIESVLTEEDYQEYLNFFRELQDDEEQVNRLLFFHA